MLKNTLFMLYNINYSYRIARNIVPLQYCTYYNQDIPIDVPAAGIEI